MTMIKEADKPTYNAKISQLFMVTENYLVPKYLGNKFFASPLGSFLLYALMSIVS